MSHKKIWSQLRQGDFNQKEYNALPDKFCLISLRNVNVVYIKNVFSLKVSNLSFNRSLFNKSDPLSPPLPLDIKIHVNGGNCKSLVMYWWSEKLKSRFSSTHSAFMSVPIDVSMLIKLMIFSHSKSLVEYLMAGWW